MWPALGTHRGIVLAWGGSEGRSGQEGLVKEEEKYQKKINLKIEGERGIQKGARPCPLCGLAASTFCHPDTLGDREAGPSLLVDTAQLHTTLLLAEAKVVHMVSLLSLRKSHRVCDKFF